MSKLKLAFIGLGRAAQHYAEVIKENLSDEYIFSVGVDQYAESRSKWEKENSGKTFSSIDEVSKDDVDIAIITTPSGSHADNSKVLLQNGVNVLCEKPIGLNVEDVVANMALAKEKNVLYGGVFQNRLNKPIKYIEKLFSQNDFGKIISASVKLQWCRLQDYYNDEWHGRWKTDGGVISQQAIHHIDALFYLFGPPQFLSGFSGNINNKLEAEDTFVASGTLLKGGFFTIEATTAVRPEDFSASLEVVTDKYQISVGGIALNELTRVKLDGVELSNELKENSETVKNGYGNGHLHMLKEISKNFNDSGKIIFPTSAESSLDSIKYIHALYSSVENNSIISFSDDVRSAKLGQDV